MQDKIFAFVEPSFYGVKYVEYTKRLGYKILVIVNDSTNPITYGYSNDYDYLITCDIRNKEDIYNAIKSFKYSDKIIGLLPATDYATPNACWVANKLGLKSMGYQSAIAARNKNIARDLFLKFNVPSPKYKAIRSYEEAKEFADLIGYPLVLKPTNTASSQFVSLIHNQSQLKSSLEELLNFKESYMGFKVNDIFLIEEFMRGQEYSIELFLNSGKTEFLEVTKKLKSKPPYFVELGHIIPAPIDNKSEFAKIAENGAKALGIENGPLHIEVIDTIDGLKIVEINGRPGGDEITSQLIPLSFGVNIFQNTIFNYLGENLKFEKSRQKYSMIYYFTAHKNGKLKKIHGLEKIKQLKFVNTVRLNVSLGDSVRIPENSDDRLGYITFYSDSYNSLIKNKKAIEETLKIEIL